MNCICNPSCLQGSIDFVPPSKSVAHRALMLGAMCGASVHNVDYSKDIIATLDCLSALGASYSCLGNTVCFSAGKLNENQTVSLYCKESGSTLRFLIPFSQALGNTTTFFGEGRLPERPLSVYFDLFDEKNISYSYRDTYLPLTVKGRLQGGSFSVCGDISSQFITGLLLSAPLFKEPAEITVADPFESKPYVDITLDLLKKFGVPAREVRNQVYQVSPCRPSLSEYTVEKDWSQAAFFLCGAAINGDILLSGMNLSSKQGDMAILEVLQTFHADISVSSKGISVKKSTLVGGDIDVRNIPDLVPVLSALACFAEGTTLLYNASRLRLKESDRLSAMYAELTKLGAKIEIGNDFLKITGGKPLHGGVVDSHNDHRIAMALAICSLGTNGEVIIENADCIDKSYPGFFRDFVKAGGKCHESY